MTIVGKLDNPEHRRQLLEYARRTAARELDRASARVTDRPHIEGTFGGAFVTFWAGTMLRGCIGRFARTDDIARTVEEVTVSSLADPRFASNPITAEELPTLKIEVSILSDLQPTTDPLSLTVGTHGIVIRRGGLSGCFLPKVASERGWSAEEFLSNCCRMKAGLPADAWRKRDIEVLLFTADVFTESDLA